MATAEEFRKEIKDRIKIANNQGREYVDILAKDIHTTIGGYSGSNHRMPVCCNVMYEFTKQYRSEIFPGDPKKGKGASLKIRYYLR